MKKKVVKKKVVNNLSQIKLTPIKVEPEKSIEELLTTRPEVIISLKKALKSGVACIAVLSMPTAVTVECVVHPFKWPDRELQSALEAFQKNIHERMEKVAKRENKNGQA